LAWRYKADSGSDSRYKVIEVLNLLHHEGFRGLFSLKSMIIFVIRKYCY